MMQSEQWHPSDIEAAAEGTENAAKRRTRSAAPTEQASHEQPAKPTTSGIMTLDKDAGSKDGLPPPQNPTNPDVQQRLRETAEKCVACYESWRSGNDGEGELTNSLHELRRVLARIEIELAASHADDGAQRAIPIPMHRAHQRGV